MIIDLGNADCGRTTTSESRYSTYVNRACNVSPFGGRGEGQYLSYNVQFCGEEYGFSLQRNQKEKKNLERNKSSLLDLNAQPQGSLKLAVELL